MADDQAEVREESPVQFTKWQIPSSVAPEREQSKKAHEEEAATDRAYRERIWKECR